MSLDWMTAEIMSVWETENFIFNIEHMDDFYHYVIL